MPFGENYPVPGEVDYALIECNGTIDTPTFYQDGMSFIQQRDDINERFENKSNNNLRQFGILLFGIDTMSQFNIRRIMPATFAYINNHQWFEMSGYNKVNRLFCFRGALFRNLQYSGTKKKYTLL